MIKEIKQKRKSIISQIIRGILYFLAGVVFLLFIFVFVIPKILDTFWGKDIPPVDDSALQLQVINLPKEENAYYDLDKISTSTELKNIPEGENLINGYLKSDTWDQTKIESLLSDNQQDLQYFDEAAGKDKFQSPNTDDPAKISRNSPLEAVGRWRQISRLSGVKAIWLAKNGKSDEAINEAFRSIIIGNAIEKSQCSTIEYLAGISIENNGLDVLQKVISIIPSGSVNLPKYQAELKKYQPSDNPAPFDGEYLMSKKYWGDMAQIEFDVSGFSKVDEFGFSESYVEIFFTKLLIENKFYFKPNLTISYFNDFYTKIIAENKKNCSEVKLVYTFPSLREENNLMKMYFTENSSGRYFAGIAELAMNDTMQKKCQLEKKVEDTTLMLDEKK
jgi:hypothetical protein